jgi:hypothetical protein
LLIRNNRKAFRRAFRRTSRQLGVGRRQRLESQNLCLKERHMSDYTEPSAVAPGMRSSLRYVEIPVVMLALLAGAAFLTKMCYLSLAFNTIFVIIFWHCFIHTSAFVSTFKSL